MTFRDYLVRADGEFVRNSRGALVKFSFSGAHDWARRHKPQSYSVIRLLKDRS